MKKLIAGLRHFQQHVLWEKRERFERSTQGQEPQALLITCSDSRVLPETLLQVDPGDLFVSRNAGNLIPGPDAPSGEAATIEYAVTALGVRDIIVCGHYRCGAVRAILHPEEAAGLNNTKQWLAHAAETRATIRSEHPGLEGEELWDRAVERNVLSQIDNLSKHPSVAAALAFGTVRLHAWALRFETSEILAFDRESRRFLPLDQSSILPSPTTDAPPASPAAEQRAKSQEPRAWACLESFKSDFAASFVVFMVALPLCLAIAKACGVPAEVGLITGVVGGILVGLLAGSPLQVSGPAAGLVVILLDIVEQHGIAMLGAITLLAGTIQCVAGGLRLGRWFRAVSPAVILGMLAGIGAVILAQQFHVALDDAPSRSPLVNFVEIPRAVVDVFGGHEGHEGHVAAALVGALTLSILVFWKRLVPKKVAAIPSVLAAVVVAAGLAAAFELPVERIDFDGLSTAVTWIDYGALPGLLIRPDVWQAAATVAVVASAETLLCATAVDQMHGGARTNYDRELAAQGVGNAVCGLLGALPMTGVIVRSSANVQAGARSRISAILHGFWILLFVLLLPDLLRLVPAAALAAILVLTGLKLIDVRAIGSLWKRSRGDAVICVLTAATVVSVDLLAGVLLGIGLSVLKLLFAFSRLGVRSTRDPDRGMTTVALEGSATFLRFPMLAAALEAAPPGASVFVEIKELSYVDHACLTFLENWKKQHEASGGTVVLDWETLHARFHRARPRPQCVRAALPEEQDRTANDVKLRRAA